MKLFFVGSSEMELEVAFDNPDHCATFATLISSFGTLTSIKLPLKNGGQYLLRTSQLIGMYISKEECEAVIGGTAIAEARAEAEAANRKHEADSQAE